MKIIDLLNKMKNGEEVPEKIKWDNTIFELRIDSLDGHAYYEELDGIRSLVSMLKTMEDLNNEIELIEYNAIDIDSIEETEIKNDGMKYFEYENNGATGSGYSKNYSAGDIETRIKINELVQAVKQLKKEIKELKEK